MKTLSFDQALQAFGYRPNEKFTFENLLLRLIQWKRDNKDERDKYHAQMQHAYHVLAAEKVAEAWKTVPLSDISLNEAKKLFGLKDWVGVPPPDHLNFLFRKLSNFGTSTLQQAERYDSAYWVLFEQARKKHPNEESYLEHPSSPIFKNIMALEAEAGWDTDKPYIQGIDYREAEAVMGIEDALKLTSSDITQKFHDLQPGCTTIAEAERLDAAYRFLFVESTKFDWDFEATIDTPYAAILRHQLDETATPSVLEEAQTEAIEVLTEPVIAEATQEEKQNMVQPVELVSQVLNLNDRYRELKEQRAFNRCATTTDARKWFGYEIEDRFTLENLQARYAQWKEDNTGESEKYHSLMARAYQLLFYEGRANSIEQRTPEILAAMHETKKLWASVAPFFQKMNYNLAREVFVSNCFENTSSNVHEEIIKDLFSWQITSLFQEHRERCLTLESARQFDEAYQFIFNRKHSLARTSGMIDPPYSLTLEQQLTAQTDNAISQPLRAETPQEDVIEAPTLSDEPISLEMDIDKAIRMFVLERDDEFDEEELTARYKDKSATTDSKADQARIDTAYQIVKAHWKAQKKAAYQKERTLFDFGLTETITVKELDFRYERASAKTDSKAEQKALDEAYQVLLKIAV